MNSLLRALALFAFVWCNVCQAAIIDFEGKSAITTTNGGYIDIDDYRFTLTNVAAGFLGVTNQVNLIESDTTKLFAANHSILTLSRVDNGLFDLLSFDIGGSWVDIPERWADTVNVSSAAGAITATLAGHPANYQTITPAFLGVNSVTFTPQSNGGLSDYEFVIDNINVGVSTVPEPQSLLLLAIGLVGFGLSRRRC